MSTKLPKNLIRLLWLFPAGALLWLTGRYVLPCAAPFLAAGALAAALERPVRWLGRRWHVPRSVASGAGVLLTVGLLGWGLFALGSRLGSELRGFVERLPRALEGLMATLQLWADRLERLSGGRWEQGMLLAAAEEWLGGLPGLISARLLTVITGAAGAAPRLLLGLVTAVIGSYFVSASYPELLRFLAAQFPERTREKLARLKKQVQSTIGRYIRAQLLLSLITFLALLMALWLLGVDYALLLALLIAVVDALPVLGAGTVLLPWGVYELLAASVERGIGLVIAYGAVTILRSCLQAKLLGDQLGLHPLLTLGAIYVGFRLWGVWGMVLCPMGAITVKQLNDSGAVRLWKSVEEGEKHGDRMEHTGRGRHERSGRHEYPSG